MHTDAISSQPPPDSPDAFDLQRDFPAAWADWRQGRPLEGRTIPDLAALLDRFEAAWAHELGPGSAAAAPWPPLALASCRIRLCNLAERTVRAPLKLARCRFEGETLFTAAVFERPADFSVAAFEAAAGEAWFTKATFKDAAVFSGAVFEAAADFTFARFERQAHFVGAVFRADAAFVDAAFLGETRFRYAVFERSLDLTQTRFAESLDLREARLEPPPGAPRRRVTLDIRHLRIGSGVLAGDLLLTRDQLRALLIAGEDSDKTEELRWAVQQYSDLVGNFHALSGPESYQAEDYCRHRCLALQQRLRWHDPRRRWLRPVWLLERLVVGVCLGNFQSPQRILLTMLAVIALCGLLYSGLLPGVNLPVRSAYNAGEHVADRGLPTALYFSVITFATVGYGDWYPLGPARLVAALEGLAGVLLTASFLVALSRRYIR